MSQKMKLLRRYSQVIEAQMAQSFLESQGISSQIRDEHIIAMNWLYSNAMGGVKLEVAEEDFQSAHRLLNQVDQGEFSLEEQDIKGYPCPKCESVETQPTKQDSKGWILGLAALTGIPLLFMNKEHWKCLGCKHEWAIRRPTPAINIILPMLIAIGVYLLIDLLILSNQ